jgi:magnesium transporter
MSDIGILHSGHDRPYRFSFYSNSLAATIHARSLSELPADGQTFEELFSGTSSGNVNGSDKPGGPTRPTSPPLFNSRPGTGMGFNRGTTVNSSLDSSYFNHGGGNAGLRKSDPKGGGNWKYDSDGDSDAKTWWLDIQSPTDEEMKMLSKVGVC